jgi:hypothetical protein
LAGNFVTPRTVFASYRSAAKGRTIALNEGVQAGGARDGDYLGDG